MNVPVVVGGIAVVAVLWSQYTGPAWLFWGVMTVGFAGGIAHAIRKGMR